MVRELANGHLDDIDVHLARVHLEALRGDPFSTLKDLQRIVQRNENDPRPILLLGTLRLCIRFNFVADVVAFL